MAAKRGGRSTFGSRESKPVREFKRSAKSITRREVNSQKHSAGGRAGVCMPMHAARSTRSS